MAITGSDGIARKLAAILAADVSGYSRLMAANEAGTAQAPREHLVSGRNMPRRHFIITALCAVAWPLEGIAQPASRVPRIGFLGLGQAADWKDQVEALRIGLKRFGYLEGRNLLVEFRWAADVSELREFAEQLSRLNVDIIIAPASTQVEPALQVTKTIPIVFASMPIRSVLDM